MHVLVAEIDRVIDDDDNYNDAKSKKLIYSIYDLLVAFICANK
jgi:hypothetical protein